MCTLVFGRTGQVARSLMPFLPKAVFLDRNVANFEEPRTLTQALQYHRPKLVINASAYTAVDRVEIDLSRARLVNADSPFEIARWCKQNGSSLIHYSTDYVYDGSGNSPWLESDQALPINRYGQTKLNGDQGILEAGGHALILRTSWIFSPYGHNFVKTMYRLGRERENLKVVGDQVGSPTYAGDLAQATLQITKHPEFQNNSGIFHISNAGWTSWFGFANEIFGILQKRQTPLRIREVHKVTSREFPTPAARPLNSKLDQRKIKAAFGIQLRTWQDALQECLEHLSSDEVSFET